MPNSRKPLRRALARVRIARARRGNRPTSRGARVASWAVVVLAGFMMTTSAVASRGTDLRPARNTDLIGLVQSQARSNRELTSRAGALRTEVDALTRQLADDGSGRKALDDAAPPAGLTAVKGPGVRVTLTDAPLEVQPAGLDPDMLVVHQQDSLMVANVLWAAGAEAMTIQDQRVTSITGIKCVGNTVVLRGIPYAPPYVITAIGDPATLEAALARSHEVAIYQEYVKAYRLGWSQERLDEVTMPAYQGSVELRHASVPQR